MPVGFSRLQVRGYRRLRELDLRLAPLNVLIGANGVGKSSVLEVVDLLADSADGSLENTISEAGGISGVLTLDGKTDLLLLELQMQVATGEPIEYELQVAREGVGYGIRRERLTQRQDATRPDPFKFIDAEGARIHYHDPSSKNLIRPNWDYKATETWKLGLQITRSMNCGAWGGLAAGHEWCESPFSWKVVQRRRFSRRFEHF